GHGKGQGVRRADRGGGRERDRRRFEEELRELASTSKPRAYWRPRSFGSRTASIQSGRRGVAARNTLSWPQKFRFSSARANSAVSFGSLAAEISVSRSNAQVTM